MNKINTQKDKVNLPKVPVVISDGYKSAVVELLNSLHLGEKDPWIYMCVIQLKFSNICNWATEL